jgi:hypothetical protein
MVGRGDEICTIVPIVLGATETCHWLWTDSQQDFSQVKRMLLHLHFGKITRAHGVPRGTSLHVFDTHGISHKSGYAIQPWLFSHCDANARASK